MNRENSRKYPSIRNNFGFQDKRESTIIPTTSDLKPLTSSTKDLSKQVHKRINLRKRSSNKTQNFIKQDVLANLSTNLDIVDPIEQLKNRINNEWQENPRIVEGALKNFRFEDIQNIKAEVQKNVSFILCQINKGQSLEDILIRKIQRSLKSKQITEKCKEKQNLVIKMLNDRINKLSVDK